MSFEQPLTYFQQRMQELGISLAEMPEIKVEFDSPLFKYQPLFSENRQGDIEILYSGLSGVHFYQDGNREKPYVRTRLHPNRCIDGKKYHTPRGAGVQVFLPPLLLKLYQERTPIPTLIITEGEFKAYKGCMHSLPCIGTQGIHNVHQKADGQIELNWEIQKLITEGQVKNIVLLFDNDCLEVTYTDDKDLFKRPNSFYTAVRNFRELTKNFNCDVYFAHIKSDSSAKGLDDLLCLHKEKEDEVKKDLLLLTMSQLFCVQNITDNSLKKLREYFHINSPEAFYSFYEETLLEKAFVFNHIVYQYDGTNLQPLVSAAIRNYIRVGDDYFERIHKPDKFGHLYLDFENRKKSTITDDYGKGALRYIKKYKSFCLVPSHTDFQQEVGECYNTYQPLSHLPTAGNIDNTLLILKHIFQDKQDFILDWLTLLYTKPTHTLPVLCLVSKERNTGKSTLGQWLMDIYESNAAKLGNADLNNSFNAPYAEKVLIVVDETSIENKVISEAIKRMSTEKGKILVNAKGRNQYPVDFIGKFCFISNDEERFMFIGKGENRFAVFKVPVLTSDDVDMRDKLKEEIPAFLNFLQNRTLIYPNKSRMYFDFSVYQTKYLDKVIQANLSQVERAIRNLLIDTFDMFFTLVEIWMSPSDIYAELKEKHKGLDETIIRMCLKEDFKMEHQGQNRYEYPSIKENRTSDTLSFTKMNGKPYLFKVQDFLSEEAYQQRLGNQDPSTDETLL